MRITNIASTLYSPRNGALVRDSAGQRISGRVQSQTMYVVYAIYNSDAQKIYIGQTEDIINRLRLHNEHTFRGYTSRFRGEWKLIYSESVTTRSEALRREKQLKSGNGRAYIKSLLQ